MASMYPQNLTYLCRRLNGFSKQCVRLQSLNASSASNGQVVQVDMPINSLVALDTLTMHFKGSTKSSAGGAACFSRGIETIIQKIDVDINGISVSASCNHYNQLWSIVSDLTVGQDATTRRKVLQNASDQASPTADVTNQPFTIQNFLGFIGSVTPQILDTNLLGMVRIRLQLAGPECLILKPGTTSATFTLDDIYFSVDVMSIDDGVFHVLHQRFLEKNNVYQLPFKNWYSFSSVGGLSQSTKFSLSTQSLNRVFACFVPGQAYALAASTGATLDPHAKASSHFKRIGNAGDIVYGDGTNSQTIKYALQNYQFNINGTAYPNFRPSAESAFSLLNNSIHTSQDALGGPYAGLSGLTQWNQSFWVAGHELAHGDPGFISGLNTIGNICQGTFDTQGSITAGATTGTGGAHPGPSLTCIVFVETSAILEVGPNRQISVVF